MTTCTTPEKAFAQRTRNTAVALATVLLSAGWMAPAAAAPVDDAQFLLVGGTVSGDVTVLRVEPSGGLTKVGQTPVGLGILSLALAPDGHAVYVSQAAEQQVTGYRIDNAGALRPIPGAEVEIDGGAPVTSTLSADGTLLFVAVGGVPGHIRTYAVDPTGALTHTASISVPGFSAIPMIRIDPDGRFLRFVSPFDSLVSSFAIGLNGELTSIGAPVSGGMLPVNPGYTPDGRFVYVSNEMGGNISGYAIGTDGHLTPTPGSPYASGLMPHGAEVTADGKRVYVPVVAGGGVAGYSNAADGALTPLAGSPYPAPSGSGPGTVVLSDDERHVYAADVLTTGVTTRVHTFDVQPDGTLTRSALPSVDTGTILGDGPIMVLTP
ncbi:lactonase family protein [Nocardia fluminea]|uniref:6-phosphogluconolactonase (Cycloisomerase 2 family) n=1 Tax=Nocardia fluminea TaxID=134984 RepID=A0A2N3WXM2_9NOCA|nr:beta-propeller fold lactonase family protein [Nocardia fluminea]PKV98642.1 6-phosphogluconolactonase (cycloisomerase 2 family) [Nocardia fluminea]